MATTSYRNGRESECHVPQCLQTTALDNFKLNWSTCRAAACCECGVRPRVPPWASSRFTVPVWPSRPCAWEMLSEWWQLAVLKSCP